MTLINSSKRLQSPTRSAAGRAIGLLALLLLIGAGAVSGQTIVDEEKLALARAAQNPIASMISVPIQNNTNFGIGEYDRNQNVTNVQPVIPASLGRWNLINRFIAPLINQPDVLEPSGSTFGLGDILYQGFFTPPSKNGVSWGVGPVLGFPTATSQNLGSGKFTAGPAAVLVIMKGKWVFGGTAYNAWSYTGQSDRGDVNTAFIQYFVNYNIKNGWFLSTVPAITANWNAPDGDKWVVPFGLGLGRLTAVGRQKLNAQIHGYWNAVKPETMDGPDWTLRVQVNLLYPR